MSPTQLVQNVLVGTGVLVTNVSYTGAPDAIGSFNGASTNLGLGTGIVLTTGTVLNTSGPLGGPDGPHGPNGVGNGGVDNGTAGYGPLTNIAGDNTFNATVLEFDFVPVSDSVTFKYVFGSEEYPEFVNAGFNDVFAFFISGPGFGGTYNMATIPGSGVPVTIDNVNATTNSSYFINNGDGTTAPQNSNPFYIQYDGFTVVIEASAQVQCGETYHLQIAIADVGDGAFDSGIFLEANSLNSYAPVVINTNLDIDHYGDNKSMVEGCETSIVTINRSSNNASLALSIPVSTGGTATEGIDYTSIPSVINFAPNQTSVSFPLDIINDAIVEGDETIIIILDQPDPCGNANFIELELIIKEPDPISINLNSETVHCPGESVSLNPTITGGVPTYSYLWSTGEVSSSISLNPTQTTSYTLTIEDICNSLPQSKTVTVSVPIYDPLTLSVSNDTSVLCPNTPVVISGQASGGDGVYSYNWKKNGLNLGSGNTKSISPYISSTYNLIVTDGCQSDTTDSVTINVLTPVLEITMGPEQIICDGDSALIQVFANGGLGGFNYDWNHTTENSSSVYVSPKNSTNYTVYVSDGCATYVIRGTTKVRITRPRASFNVLSSDPMEGLPVYFQNNSVGSTSWEWDFGNGQVSNEIVPNTVYRPWGHYDVQLVAISDAGCTDTIVKTIFIKPEFYFYAPNAFTPDGNRFNNEYSVSLIGSKEFHFLIYNRWGELIFESYDPEFSWDGTYGGSMVKDDVYVYKCFITDLTGYKQLFEGFVTVLR